MYVISVIFIWTTVLILCEPDGDFSHLIVKNDSQFNKEATEVLKASRPKRSRNIYEPIRILPYYSFDKQLLPEEKKALQQVIEKAVRKISKLFSVISLKRPLLLPRSDCPAIFSVGINKGKCAKIPKGYKGEYCVDNFKIPNSHLQSFIIYNKTSPDPINVYRDGEGIPDVDYVLYVISQTTDFCNPYKTSAVAYATTCQLYGSDRPLAGLVNFCPRTVKSQKFDQEVLYKAALHELFHALGFSNRLYEKFKKCNEDGLCAPWPQPILRPSDGVLRLVTDAVVREMRRHFNCSRPDFGGPIELLSSSHWDSIFMHSSIMGSKEQKPYQALIDPITLAVFEDSGWYKVNYSEADKFIWGKDQGCSFGLKTYCESQDGFCLGNSTGCHHLHLSKARCNSFNSSTCGVYAADQKPCFINSVNGSSMEDEIYSPSSRCFLSSLPVNDKIFEVQEKIGRCYQTKCEEGVYYVRINGSEWQLCQPGAHIKVAKYEGEILCPSLEVICSEFIQTETEDQVSLSSPSHLETEATTVMADPCTVSGMLDYTSTSGMIDSAAAVLISLQFDLFQKCSQPFRCPLLSLDQRGCLIIRKEQNVNCLNFAFSM